VQHQNFFNQNPKFRSKLTLNVIFFTSMLISDKNADKIKKMR